MANERMVPLLPCASIDEMRDFYLLLGFEVTYRQVKPNPYLGLRREDLELHYFGMDGFRPEDSYGVCCVERLRGVLERARCSRWEVR